MLDYEFTGKIEPRCPFCNEMMSLPETDIDNIEFDEDGYTEIVCDKCGETVSFNIDAFEEFNKTPVAKTAPEEPEKEKEPFEVSPITDLSEFSDDFGWKDSIAKLTDDEIYARYRDDFEWSDEYRELCYEELCRRGY